MRDQIIEILGFINPEGDYETSTTLIDDRTIDSLGMVALVADLEDTFDIIVPAVEIVADNFNSVDAMVGLVSRLMEE